MNLKSQRIILHYISVCIVMYSCEVVLYRPLAEPLIRDFWDNIFHLCKQDDISCSFTAGSGSRQLTTGTQRRYVIIYIQVLTVIWVVRRSISRSIGQSRESESGQRVSRRTGTKWLPIRIQLKTPCQRSIDVMPCI